MLKQIPSSIERESAKSTTENLPSLVVNLLNRQITCITSEAIIREINRACFEDDRIVVANYNVHSFNLSMQLPWFYDFLQNAEIAHCDGSGILKGLSYMGLDLPMQYRVSYTVLMPKLLESCNEKGLSVFMLGSKDEYVQTALHNLRQQYPNLKVDGHHGYFDRENQSENQAVIDKINQKKPNILLVGMGMPIQENWVKKHRYQLNVNVFLTGGAVIDRLAGMVADCPDWIANAGLEWLYRLYQEPKRLASRYLFGNLAFILHLALAKSNQFAPLQVREIELTKDYSQKSKNRVAQISSQSTVNKEFSVSVKTKIEPLGEYLVEAGLLTKRQVADALSEQQRSQMYLGDILIKKGWIKKQTLDYFLKKS
jgi:N-acetylglucosaminyldiphosphoundecaprenol N-acetyl-beta-D-mannosaminyltransferase